MSKYTPRHPRPRSTLGSPLMLQALGAAGAMITDEYIWGPIDNPPPETWEQKRNRIEAERGR